MNLQEILKNVNLEYLIPAIGGFVSVISFYFLFKTIQDTNKWLDRRGKKEPPGPIGLPIVGYLPFLGKEPYKVFFKLREKYGDVIGVYLGRKHTVILNEYRVVKQVLSDPAALNRAPGILQHLDPNGIMNTNGEVWKEQRKYCMNTTQELGLARGHWEDLIIDEISQFTGIIQDQKGRPFDTYTPLMASLISSITTLLLGRRISEKAKIEMLVNYASTVVNYSGNSLIANLVPGLRKFCEVFKIGGYDKAAQYTKDFSSFLIEEINRHKNSEFKDVRDFINCYLDKMAELSKSKNTKHFFSEAELQGNLVSLFLGATDTIFSSLGWLFRIMSAHKDVQEKVYQEIMSAFGKDGRARYDERDKIPYTFAVIMEAQRYGCNVPMSGNRIASDDIAIHGLVIPKGTEIIANLYALHRDPNYWNEPEKFRPERFLTPDGTKLIKQPESFAPFSVGRRMCPGEAIAWMDILLYFSETVKKFEICTPPGVKPEFEIVLGLVQHLVPQPLCFKERVNTD